MLRQYLDLPRAVHILCVGTFINRAGTFLVPFLSFYLTERLGLGEAFATQTIGVFGIGSMAAALVGGHLADRIGRRVVMVCSLFGGAAILIIFSRLTSPTAIVATIFTYALVAETYRPAASAMIADLVEPHRRSLAFGLMYVSINLGFAVSPVIGGTLAAYSFQFLFWGDALTCSLYGLLIFLAIRETLPARVRSTAGSVPNATTEPLDDASAIEAAKHILRDGPFQVFCLATLLAGMVFMQSFGALPLYLHQLGFTVQDYGRIIAVNGLLICCFQIPLTSLLNRFRRERVIVVGALVIGAGFGLTALARTGWQFAATVVVWTLGEMMHAPFMHAVVSDLAPIRLRARYMGVLSVCFAGAMTVGVPIGGWVLAHFNPRVVWLICLVTGVVAALLYWSIHRRICAGYGNRVG